MNILATSFKSVKFYFCLVIAPVAMITVL
jgi:hypothetical protein